MPGEINTAQLEAGILSADAAGRALFATGVIDAATFLDAVAAGAVTNTALASGAGVGALLTAGLGGSDSILESETATHTLVAAHGSKDRACLVVVVVDEVFATGDTSQTVIEIGETDNVNKCMANTVLVDAALASVWVFAFTNTATKAIIATSVAAAGTGTGGCSITVLAIPTT